MSCLLMFMLFVAGEVLEKRHGGGICEDKLHIFGGGENPPASGGIDRLDGKQHGLSYLNCSLISGGIVDNPVVSLPRPHLGGLPRFRQSYQSDHHGGEGRSLRCGDVVLGVTVCVGVSVRILENGRQGKFISLAGFWKLKLQFFHCQIVSTLRYSAGLIP